MAKTKVLKLNGKPFNLKPIPPAIEKIIQLLKSAPKDEIFTAGEVCAKVGAGADYLRSSDRMCLLDGYTATVGRLRYLGNPAAIAELLRQAGER